MDNSGIDELDTRGACAAIDAAHRDLVELECRQLRLAVHWLDLHAPEDHADGLGEDGAGDGHVLPGTERFIRSGADGTPMVGEFAAAEFGALQEMHPAAAAARLRNVANLRWRHPQLWSRVMSGEVRAWKALETAKLVGRHSAEDPGLSLDQARWVDERTASWIDTLPWGAYLELVEKTMIAADPEAAEARRLRAATSQGVWAGQSAEHGLKHLVARANAGDVLYLVAVVDRLAEILSVRGDTRPLGPRRATALGILAHPAHALRLLATGTAQGDLPGEPTDDPVPPDPADADDGSDGDDGAPDSDVRGTEVAETTSADEESCPATAPSSAPGGAHAAGADLDRSGLRRASYLDLPDDLAGLLGRIDAASAWDKLRPEAVLYVHVDADALASGAGAATVEGIGATTLEQAKHWLGHTRVRLATVIDPPSESAVDGYTFPPRLREAIRHASPRDAFPYAVNTGRGMDIDHPVPYLPPTRGGPPGQTGIDNAAPMVRHHHRLKTHGRWRLRQLAPGIYLWRSPHGYRWLTDPTGTRRLPTPVADLLERALDQSEHVKAA